ncbi:glycosyltransferase family 4 protein [bacterium]|nr:glycosyltransferase family 4 protein [bacterium]
MTSNPEHNPSKDKMRIGIVTAWFERGAAYVSKQLRDSLASEHDVYIYARGGEAFAKDDPNWDHEYVTWGKQPLVTEITAVHIKHFKNWIRRKNLDIVIFNEQRWWRAVLAAREAGVRTGSYVDFYTQETKPCFDAYDFLICNTQRHTSVFKEHSQVIFVPWGTDTATYKPARTSPPQKLRFFHSAGMNPHRKGTDIVLKAFSDLASDKAELIIHSQKDIAACFPHLNNLIKGLKANKQLTIVERTVTAPGLYHLGDVYVYPSRLDGIGLTLPEAISCGLPVIATDEAPMNEFFNSGFGVPIPVTSRTPRDDGYYWPEVEPCVDSTTRAMQQYIEMGDVVLKQSRSARNHAVTKLDWRQNSVKLSHALANIKRRKAHEIANAINCINELEPQKQWARERHPHLYEVLQKLRRCLPNSAR